MPAPSSSALSVLPTVHLQRKAMKCIRSPVVSNKDDIQYAL